MECDSSERGMDQKDAAILVFRELEMKGKKYVLRHNENLCCYVTGEGKRQG